jgi:hypothetical protein
VCENYKIFVGKSQGTAPLERPIRDLKVNVRMDVREVGWGVMGWVYVARDRD